MQFELICLTCKHYNMKEGDCAAFKEIPYEIYVGLDNHSEPLKNQKNNIIYVPIIKDGQQRS